MRLTVEGKEVDLRGTEQVVVSRSANDFIDLESRQGDYSNTFSAPKTTKNKAIFEDSHIVNSATKKPYRKLPATLSAGGVEMIGNLIIKSSKKDYELLFTSSNADFFQAIEGKKLSDLNLSDLNHTWTVNAVNGRRNNTSGIVYPVADYNADDKYISNDRAAVDWRSLVPNIFVKDLVSRIALDAGFSLTGDLLLIPEYNELTIPLLNFRDRLNDPAFATMREIELTTNHTFNFSGFETKFFKVPFFTKVNDPLNLFDNSTGTYNYTHLSDFGTTYNRMCFRPDGMSFKGAVNVELTVTKGATAGDGKIQLFIDRLFNADSAPIATSEVALPSAAGTFTVSVSFPFAHDTYRESGNLFVALKPGTFGSSQTVKVTGSFKVTGVDLKKLPGHSINVSDSLPDISQTDLIKTVFNRYLINPITKRKTVNCVAFKSIFQNKGVADNWTPYVDNSEEPELKFLNDNYGQVSELKYAEDETVPLGLGNHSILIENENLPQKAELITLPFAFSESITRLVGVKLAKINLLEELEPKNKLKPRLLRVKTNSIGVKTFLYHSENTEELKWIPMLGYVAKTNPVGFTFTQFAGSATVTGSYSIAVPCDSWQELFTSHYLELARALKNYKEVELLVKLPHSEAILTRFDVPVFIEHPEVGGFYYKAEIMQHELSANKSCTVRLIKI
jgi:hypothetical protein